MKIKHTEGKEFSRPSDGTHQAVCYAIWDIGMQEITWNNEKKVQPKLIISWELDQTIEDEGEYKGKRYVVSKRYTNSDHQKSNLVAAVKAWGGGDMTKDQLNGFDLDKLIGENCLLGIVNETNNGKTYTNITSISPIMDNQTEMKPEYDGTIPDWVKKLQEKGGVGAIPGGSVDFKDIPTDSPTESLSEEESDIPF